MKMLFTSPIAPEVDLLNGLLDEAGIATEVRNVSTYPNFPGAPFQPELWVLNDSDYEKACEVRDAWRQPVPGVDAEHVESRQPDTSGATFLGLFLLAAFAVVAWLNARAGNWLILGAAFVFFCPLGVLCLLLGRQARQRKQNQKSKTS